MKGCSESDISFSNNVDSGGFVGANDSPTAPADKSCHIFDDNGGKVTFNMEWEKYQVPVEDFDCCPQNLGQIYFKNQNGAMAGVGTAENEIMTHFNFINLEICLAYNRVLGNEIDYTVADSMPILGDENTGYYGLENFCAYHTSNEFGQIRHIWLAK
jgi:hypothetical protein